MNKSTYVCGEATKLSNASAVFGGIAPEDYLDGTGSERLGVAIENAQAIGVSLISAGGIGFAAASATGSTELVLGVSTVALTVGLVLNCGLFRSVREMRETLVEFEDETESSAKRRVVHRRAFYPVIAGRGMAVLAMSFIGAMGASNGIFESEARIQLIEDTNAENLRVEQKVDTLWSEIPLTEVDAVDFAKEDVNQLAEEISALRNLRADAGEITRHLEAYRDCEFGGFDEGECKKLYSLSQAATVELTGKPGPGNSYNRLVQLADGAKGRFESLDQARDLLEKQLSSAEEYYIDARKDYSSAHADKQEQREQLLGEHGYKKIDPLTAPLTWLEIGELLDRREKSVPNLKLLRRAILGFLVAIEFMLLASALRRTFTTDNIDVAAKLRAYERKNHLVDRVRNSSANDEYTWTSDSA